MLERDIERYLIAQVNARGGELRKVKWIGRRGAPDRFVMLPDRSFWIELKAPGEKLKAHQWREHMRMRLLGQDVVVADSYAAVTEALACDASI